MARLQEHQGPGPQTQGGDSGSICRRLSLGCGRKAEASPHVLRAPEVNVFTPVSQVRTPRFREGKQPAQEHTATGWDHAQGCQLGLQKGFLLNSLPREAQAASGAPRPLQDPGTPLPVLPLSQESFQDCEAPLVNIRLLAPELGGHS